MAFLDHGVYVDALPYTDKGYDEIGVKEAALNLVEDEVRRYRPTKNYLEYLSLPPLPAETDIMRNEFERISNRIPMERISMRRYDLPQPPASKINDIKAWMQSLENSQSQLMNMEIKTKNLDLLLQYGANAWKNSDNKTLEYMLKCGEERQKSQQQKIQELNWNRKKEQTEVGEKLKYSEETWVGLVGKNYEIEQAILEIEQEIDELSNESKDNADMVTN